MATRRESILHMVTCREPIKLWNACAALCATVLNEPNLAPVEAAVFNVPAGSSPRWTA